jgi:RNA polymerase sigma factor (sigma-70 family)
MTKPTYNRAMATGATSPDAALVTRLVERDRRAWEELYREYEPRLFAFAYRLTGNRNDAADLVQETFVHALPRLDELDPEQVNVAAYLFTTAKNLFLKGVERGRRLDVVDEVPEPDDLPPIEDDPERQSLLTRQQQEVRLATVKLAPRQRLVLALRELEDKSYAEIGELVGLNENAVAQLISRARDRLREELRLVQVDRSKLPEECQRMLPLLSAHLDGRLTGEARERTLSHLQACELCQAALADMEEARRRYRALIPLLDLDDMFRHADRALAATGYWDRADLRRLGRRAGIRLGAAVIIVLATAGGVPPISSLAAAATVRAGQRSSAGQPSRPRPRLRPAR